jgi:short-subunit dehydrogenase
MPTNARPVALVTGASAGIGRSFAYALADRGHDLVLVARDTARLEALGKEIGDAYGATCEVLTADLADDAALATFEARLADAGRPVDLLVNNAGFGTSGQFHTLPVEREEQEIRLNVLALVRLCHAALDAQVARGRGGVINVASIAGYQPTPGNATYGATKAFVSSFSQAVHEELRGTGVRCMVLSPGFTRTEFQARAGIDSSEVPGFLWQEAATVVDHALRAYGKGRAVCVPGPLNSATAAFTAVTPHSVTRKIAGVIVNKSEK